MPLLPEKNLIKQLLLLRQQPTQEQLPEAFVDAGTYFLESTVHHAEVLAATAVESTARGAAPGMKAAQTRVGKHGPQKLTDKGRSNIQSGRDKVTKPKE